MSLIFNILKDNLLDIPIDIIKEVMSFVCNCEIKKCNFCNENQIECNLIICASCKQYSCNGLNCPKFNISFIIQYDEDLHKIRKCCSRCENCLT